VRADSMLPMPSLEANPSCRCGSDSFPATVRAPSPGAYFGAVIIGKSSVRNGVRGRPFLEQTLQTGFSAQA